MTKGKSPLILLLLALVLLPAELRANPPTGDDRMGRLPPMRTIRTRHYLIKTDIDESVAREMAERMDVMFDEYQRRLADFALNREFRMLDVYLFQNKDDYSEFTQNRFPNTGGVFLAGRTNALAAFLEGQGRDAMRRTLQHEAFHQFAFNAIGPDLPIWLNEGMAQLFEEGLWTGKTFLLGQVAPRRLRQLKADIAADRLIDFQTMLAMTSEQWSKNLADDANQGATQYNQAWAMVHYLVHGENGVFRKRLIHMLKLLHGNTDAGEAFRTAFSSNYQGFQKRFTDWADAVTATPEAAMIDRQGVLGDLLISLADSGKRFKDVQSFRKTVTAAGYQLQYSKGDVKWKTEKLDTYFSHTDGQLMDTRQLYFDTPTVNAPLPDIVCHVTDRVRLRTQFYQMGGKVWHELKIEPNR